MALPANGIAVDFRLCFLHGNTCELSSWHNRTKYVLCFTCCSTMFCCFIQSLTLWGQKTYILLSVKIYSTSKWTFKLVGMAGLAVTYGLNLNARMSRWILSFCKLENRIISVERIYQYCKLPSEAPLIIENCRPPSSWPENGNIELIDLKVCFISSGNQG